MSMGSSPDCARPGCLPLLEAWRLRARTARAMAYLVWARTLVGLVPIRWWRGALGLSGLDPDVHQSQEARRLALHVERAAGRLPLHILCLPRAMALSWMLRQGGIPHRLVMAVKPLDARGMGDDLHAWIDVGGERVIGELPGPWIEVAILPLPLASK